MNYMIKVAVEANLLKDSSATDGLDDDKLLNLLDDVYPLVVDKLYQDKSRRINQASIVTLYEKIIQLNNKRKPENKGHSESKNNNNEENDNTTIEPNLIIELVDAAAADPDTSSNTRENKSKRRKTAHTRQTTLTLTNTNNNNNNNNDTMDITS